MSYSDRSKGQATATIADASSTGDKVTLTPTFPVEVIEFGIVVTTALVKASGGVIVSCDQRITAGSDTGRVTGAAAAAGGIMTLTNAQSNKAAGKVVKCRPASPMACYPGQQAILNLSTGADSGAGIGFINWRELGASDQTQETVVASA